MDPTAHNADEIFSQLSPDDEKILISLPYRIGLYVSFSDITGGWDAQEAEMKSLTSMLREFSEDFYKTEFAQKVLRECLQARGQWPSLSNGVDKVPDQAKAMVRTLSAMLMPDELEQFCALLMDIAFAVAMAFRENDRPVSSQEKPILREILSRLGGILAEKHPLDHINISESERAALRSLADMLEYKRL